MTQPLQIPLPLHRTWPVGLRLRFRLDAMMRRPCYRYLRGVHVLVLSGLTLHEDTQDWRQYVAVFGARCAEDRFGWARPGQLEVIPGDWDDPGMQLGEQATPGKDKESRLTERPCPAL